MSSEKRLVQGSERLDFTETFENSLENSDLKESIREMNTLFDGSRRLPTRSLTERAKF